MCSRAELKGTRAEGGVWRERVWNEGLMGSCQKISVCRGRTQKTPFTGIWHWPHMHQVKPGRTALSAPEVLPEYCQSPVRHLSWGQWNNSWLLHIALPTAMGDRGFGMERVKTEIPRLIRDNTKKSVSFLLPGISFWSKTSLKTGEQVRDLAYLVDTHRNIIIVKYNYATST